MKNKPHPRWIQSGSNTEFEKWHTRSQARAVEGGSDASDLNSPSASSSPSLAESSPDSGNLFAQPLCIPPPPYVYSSSQLTFTSANTTLDPNSHHVHNPYHSTHSPVSDTSSAIATPTEELPACPPIIVGDQQTFESDFDFSSMFMSYPDLVSYNEGFSHTDHRPRLQAVSIPQYHKTCSAVYQGASPRGESHCGCINEPSSYNAVLELSLRLRKAADILSCSANHRMGAKCLLHQRVAELDTFATYVDINNVWL
jgi:hypothetical protein